MRNVTKEIRGAYLELLSDLTFMGVQIPIRSGMINDSGADIVLSNGVSFNAYVLITNQSRGVNTMKNGMDYKSQLTVDVNTVFSGDSFSMAGSEWVESITDKIYDLLYDKEVFRLKEFGIGFDKYNVTYNSNFSQPMPLQYTDTSRVFRSVLIFENGIHHTVLDEPITDLWIKTI